MKPSECRNEIDRLLSDSFEEEEERGESRRNICRIVAPFANRLPKGGGRVIRSPRILFEELVM